MGLSEVIGVYPHFIIHFRRLFPAIHQAYQLFRVAGRHRRSGVLVESGAVGNPLRLWNLSIHPSIHPSIYLSVHPSIYLSIYLYIYIHIYIQITYIMESSESGSTYIFDLFDLSWVPSSNASPSPWTPEMKN